MSGRLSELRAERLAAAIRREVAAAPPLGPEQIAQLRGLLPAPAQLDQGHRPKTRTA